MDTDKDFIWIELGKVACNVQGCDVSSLLVRLPGRIFKRLNDEQMLNDSS